MAQKAMKSQETPPSYLERISHAAGLVSAGTLISRILGFVRDMLLARWFGTSISADAYYVAFRIPNMLRELLAEGAMSAAFVPVFTEYLSKKSKHDAARLVRATFTILFLLLTLVVVLGMVFTPLIVGIVAPGFLRSPETFQLTVLFTRIMFPFILLISLSALAMGILNSTGHFVAPAISSAVFNVVHIGCVLGSSLVGPALVYGAALGVVVGGIAQLAIQLPAIYREGFLFRIERPIWPFHPGVKQIGQLMLPATLGLSVTQINLFVNTVIASYLAPGSVSYLYYSTRLLHFPLALFAIALSTVILPTLSTQAAKGEKKALVETFSFGLRLIFFITFPAMVGLMVLRQPIVHLLFEHGAFDAMATEKTADALFFYTTGIWALAGTRILVSLFYALQDTRTPTIVGMITVCVNIPLNLLLMYPLKHNGLALATALSGIFQFFMLLCLIRKKIGLPYIAMKQVGLSHLKATVASLGIVFPCLFISRLSLWHVGGTSWVMKGVMLAAGITTGVGLYFLIQRWLKSEELTFIVRMMSGRMKGRGKGL